MFPIRSLDLHSFIGIEKLRTFGPFQFTYALGEIENIVAGDEVERLAGHEIYEWAEDGLQLARAMEDSKVEAMVTRLVLRKQL